MIPDEAVEAAARAWSRNVDAVWDAMPPLARATALTKAKRALEAAAPFMLATAWDEGEQAGVENHAAEEFPEVPDRTNPYRSQP